LLISTFNPKETLFLDTINNVGYSSRNKHATFKTRDERAHPRRQESKHAPLEPINNNFAEVAVSPKFQNLYSARTQQPTSWIVSFSRNHTGAILHTAAAPRPAAHSNENFDVRQSFRSRQGAHDKIFMRCTSGELNVSRHRVRTKHTDNKRDWYFRNQKCRLTGLIEL
jgi:hypothetical protein